MTPKTGRWLPAFLALACIWGASFALVEIILVALSPIQLAFGRLLLGATSLGVLTAAVRAPLPRSRRTWLHLFVVAAMWNSVPFTLFAYGQQYVPSVLAGIINGATPLTTLCVILLAFPEERPTVRRVAGLLLGFVGVCVVLGVWQAPPAGELRGMLACVGAVCCYGVAFPYARRHLNEVEAVGPLSLAAGQVGLAACQMLPVVLLLDPVVVRPLDSGVIVALLALGVLGSGLAYVLNFHIVTHAGASAASQVTYLVPVVATIVGVALLDEGIGFKEPIGGMLVLAGVAVAQGASRNSRAKRQAAAEVEGPG